MIVSEINLLEILSQTLDTREASTRLFDFLYRSFNTSSIIKLDFSSIEFMSRSFADQFHKERLAFQAKTNCLIELKNADIQIVEILHAVSNTQKSRSSIDNSNISILTFSNPEQLEEYMFAL